MSPPHTFLNSCCLFEGTTKLGLIHFSSLILILKGSRTGGNGFAAAIMQIISSLLGPGHGHVVFYGPRITYVFYMSILGWKGKAKFLLMKRKEIFIMHLNAVKEEVLEKPWQIPPLFALGCCDVASGLP